MIVLGFTVPLFNLGNQPADQQQQAAEPRLCQADADCYLLCEDKPVEVLCRQNLCQQNGCEEAAVYPYAEKPVSFNLNLVMEGQAINLMNRSNSNDFFVKVEETPDSKGSSAHIHTLEFPLALILEKLDIGLTSECLFLDKQSYCNDDKKQLRLLVNGEESFQYGELVPGEGEKVEIRYE